MGYPTRKKQPKGKGHRELLGSKKRFLSSNPSKKPSERGSI
jgi:hypothetical protein